MKLGLGADSVLGLLWLPGKLVALHLRRAWAPLPEGDTGRPLGSPQLLLFAAGAPGVC